MDRIQLLLHPSEHQALKQLASDARQSMSEMVRELIRERVRQKKRQALQAAARMMEPEYHANPELTAFSDAIFDEELPDEAR
jgi:hypothetical protein